MLRHLVPERWKRRQVRAGRTCEVCTTRNQRCPRCPPSLRPLPTAACFVLPTRNLLLVLGECNRWRPWRASTVLGRIAPDSLLARPTRLVALG